MLTEYTSFLIEDGVDEDRTVTVHEGVDIDRVARTEPLNVRAAFWHIMGDTLSSVGVIAGGQHRRDQ